MLNIKAERARAHEQLQQLNTVPDDPDRHARLLSGGNQQKVVLARWLLHECRVLMLDEPTRGVDVATKAEIYRIVSDLAKAGLGVLVVSSELEELVGICSRILVMREGEIVAEVDGPGRHRTRAAPPRRRTHRCPSTRRGGRMTTSQAEAAEGPSRAAGAFERAKTLEAQQYVLAGVLVLLFIVGAVLKPDTFPTWDNIRNMLTQASVIGVLAMGMTFVIATAGIDLSVGSMVAAAGLFGGILIGDDGTSTLVFIAGADGLRHRARHGERDRRGLRPGRAVHRDAGDVLDRPGNRVAAERQAAGQPARPERRLVRRPGRASRWRGSATAGSWGSRCPSTSSSRSRSRAGCS